MKAKSKQSLIEARKEHRQFGAVIRIFICIATAGGMLFAYIEKQNDLTELRLAIPVLAKEVREIQEKNISLSYEIERSESPILLMEVMRKPEYSHLRYPYFNEQIILPRALPLPIISK